MTAKNMKKVVETHYTPKTVAIWFSIQLQLFYVIVEATMRLI
jgi:hypothetical protein